MKRTRSTVIDVFCGVGGLTHGFVKEGFNVVAGIDVDRSCQYAYERNNDARFIPKCIEDVTPEEIIKAYPKNHVKILVGCAPCRPFSKYANRKSKDEEWKLVLAFAELIRAVQPEIASMENVPQLEGHGVFKKLLKVLKEEEYHVTFSVVECVDYGVPQTRRRLVLFASKFGEIEMLKKTHPLSRRRTVAKIIRRLNPIRAGQKSRTDPLHRACDLSPLNLKRITNTPPGGSWRDWPKALLLECHKKPSGKTYVSIYGRMSWDAPSPTITTQCHGLGNGRFGHPTQHRAITLREAALLQTFPKYYELVDPDTDFSTQAIARHIGNAVPPRLGRIIARSIRRHLAEYDAD